MRVFVERRDHGSRLKAGTREGKRVQAFVYILASKRHGTLYVGATGDLARRIWQHRSGVVPGFTRDYAVTRLVYYEVYESILEARARERTLKRWRRDWKITLIEERNPEWSDLTPTLA